MATSKIKIECPICRVGEGVSPMWLGGGDREAARLAPKGSRRFSRFALVTHLNARHPRTVWEHNPRALSAQSYWACCCGYRGSCAEVVAHIAAIVAGGGDLLDHFTLGVIAAPESARLPSSLGGFL